jgi:flagellin-like hook-associated protein FlgL
MATIENGLSGRVSDLSTSQQTRRNIAQSQQALEVSRNQVGTGKQSGRYASMDLVNNLKSFLRTEQQGILAKGRKDPYLKVSENLNTSIVSVNRMKDIAAEFRQRVHSAQDPSATDLSFASYCQAKLNEVQQLLNKNNSLGMPVFGGSETSRPPVDVTLMATPAAGDSVSTASTAYFQGKSGGHTTSVEDSETFQYGVSADEPAFRDLLFWLKKGSVITPDHSPGSNASIALTSMTDGLGQTVRDLSNVGDRLGAQLGQVENMQSTNDADQRQFQEILSRLNDTDPYQAYIDMAQGETRTQLNHMIQSKQLQSIMRVIDGL